MPAMKAADRPAGEDPPLPSGNVGRRERSDAFRTSMDRDLACFGPTHCRTDTGKALHAPNRRLRTKALRHEAASPDGFCPPLE